jgi:Protein of unknown function (DUF3551)
MTTKRVALILVGLAAASTLGGRDSAAQYSPWCVQYIGRDSGASTCTFASYEQCQMTATPGSGGFCTQNPWYGQGPGQSGQGRRR